MKLCSQTFLLPYNKFLDKRNIKELNSEFFTCIFYIFKI